MASCVNPSKAAMRNPRAVHLVMKSGGGNGVVGGAGDVIDVVRITCGSITADENLRDGAGRSSPRL